MGNTLKNCVSTPEESDGSNTNLLQENSESRHLSSQQQPQNRDGSSRRDQSQQRYYLSPSMSRRADELSEDEQVKIAKRMGLIGYLPIRFFTHPTNDDEKECAICMVEYETGDELRYLPCTHSFHKACIDAWLMRSFTCPNCSQPVDSGLVGSFEPLGAIGGGGGGGGGGVMVDGQPPLPAEGGSAEVGEEGAVEESPSSEQQQPQPPLQPPDTDA